MVISLYVVGVVVAPALAALTEVDDVVVAAPLEVPRAKGCVAASAIFISLNAGVVATPLIPFASVHALGLMGKDQEEEQRD